MTLKRLWLTFAQAATIALGVLFVVTTLRPEWLAMRDAPSPVFVKQAPPSVAPVASAGSYSEAVGRAAPAVVNIFTSGAVKQRHPFAEDPIFRRFFSDMLDEPRRAASLGSGVIVAPKGYVLTNNHVIEGMDEIEVLLADGKTRLKARVIGSDPETDLAVLKVDREDLPAITFGNADSVRTGDVVLAIGNPFGVGQTVTMGIVSAVGRRGLNLNTYENFIQTDASINPGNSGGALVDVAGNLIGINTAIFSRTGGSLGINTFENFIQTDAAINPGNSGGALVDVAGNLLGINTAIFSRTGGSLGIGFAIPVSTARQVMESLIKDGRVTRGWIGVEPRDLTPEMAKTLDLPVKQGVLIAGLVENGPASEGGIRLGDVVVKVAEAQVNNTPQLLNAVAALKPRQTATLTVQRGNKRLDVPVTVGQRPPTRPVMVDR